MQCLKCDSKRILCIDAKHNDMFSASIGQHQMNGYQPDDFVNFGGGGDYTSFEVCLDCGTIQGEWPHPLLTLESGTTPQED